MNYFDMDALWSKHFMEDKLLIKVMPPNLSLSPRRHAQGRCHSWRRTEIASAHVGRKPEMCEGNTGYMA